MMKYLSIPIRPNNIMYNKCTIILQDDTIYRLMNNKKFTDFFYNSYAQCERKKMKKKEEHLFVFVSFVSRGLKIHPFVNSFNRNKTSVIMN